jgi:hypothetical protein
VTIAFVSIVISVIGSDASSTAKAGRCSKPCSSKEAVSG